MAPSTDDEQEVLFRESQLRFNEFFPEEDNTEDNDNNKDTSGSNNNDNNNNNNNNNNPTTNTASKQKFQKLVRTAIPFQKGEANTIRRVLQEIDTIALKRTTEGFNEFNFTVGVMNCLLISYVFGACPQHMWLLYLVEGSYMIPRKFYTMWYAKPLNQALYYLDFCWCMNFTAMLFLLGLIMSEWVEGVGKVDASVREPVLNAMVGLSCGTLMGANIVLPFVACLFHDVVTMTGFFIHIMPPLVMYTFMWCSDEIKEAWPSLFDLSYMEKMRYFPDSGPFFVPGSALDTVAGNAVVLYLAWWMPYVIFMLLVGIDLPKKYKPDGITPAHPKYDTVFHSTMRGGPCISFGKIFRNRSKKDSLKQMEDSNFDLVDFMIYMGLHMLAALTAVYTSGYLCFKSREFHFCMLVFITVLAVMRGAQRYTYYSTRMYSRALRKQFAYILDAEKES